MSATRLPDDDPDVDDMHIARILAMSGEELRAEMIAQGIDPDEAVRQSRAAAEHAIAECKKPWHPIRTVPKDGSKIWVQDLTGEIHTLFANPEWAATEARRHYTHWRPYIRPPS